MFVDVRVLGVDNGSKTFLSTQWLGVLVGMMTATSALQSLG